MKKLIPALCLLLVTAVLMGTSTFAWFSMNNSVSATGMQVKAVSSSALVISDSLKVGTANTVAFSRTAKELIPATHTGTGSTGLQYVKNTNAISGATGYQNSTVAVQMGEAENKATAGTYFYEDYEVYIATVGSTIPDKDLKVYLYTYTNTNDGEDTVKATSVDFYVQQNSTGTLNYVSTLNLEKTTGDDKDGDYRYRTADTDLLRCISIPQNGSNVEYIKVLMRVYYDGALKMQDAALTPASGNATAGTTYYNEYGDIVRVAVGESVDGLFTGTPAKAYVRSEMVYTAGQEFNAWFHIEKAQPEITIAQSLTKLTSTLKYQGGRNISKYVWYESANADMSGKTEKLVGADKTELTDPVNGKYYQCAIYLDDDTTDLSDTVKYDSQITKIKQNSKTITADVIYTGAESNITYAWTYDDAGTPVSAGNTKTIQIPDENNGKVYKCVATVESQNYESETLTYALKTATAALSSTKVQTIEATLPGVDLTGATYQWKTNADATATGTSNESVYKAPNATESYKCEITIPGDATPYVTNAVAVTEITLSVDFTVGNPIVATVAGNGAFTPTYEWKSADTSDADARDWYAAGDTNKIDTPVAGKFYKCTVTVGDVVLTQTVEYKVAIEAKKADDSTVITATPKHLAGTPAYQWYEGATVESGNLITDATAATYTGAATAGTHNYYVVVNGTYTSNVVSYTLD